MLKNGQFSSKNYGLFYFWGIMLTRLGDTDRLMDRQPQNIPPTPKDGGGIKL